MNVYESLIVTPEAADEFGEGNPCLTYKKFNELTPTQVCEVIQCCIGNFPGVPKDREIFLKKTLNSLQWYTTDQIKEQKGWHFITNEKMLYFTRYGAQSVDMEQFIQYDVEKYVQEECPPFCAPIKISASNKFLRAVKKYKEKETIRKQKAKEKKALKQIEKAKKILAKSNIQVYKNAPEEEHNGR